MKTLRVLLLGTPEVRWEEQLLPIQRRYPRALLLYLASQGAMVGRDELLTIFWEDQNERTSRLRLRETLNKLRASLPNQNILLSSKDLVGLDFQRVWVDLLEFENLSKHPWSIAKQIPAQEPLPEDIYQALSEAISLWRGPRFLAGSSLPSTPQLDEWLSRYSQRTEHMRGSVLERLSEHAFVVGDNEESLRFARLALENDELSENIHERILRILIRMDRRNEARQHFKYIMQVTRRELDQSPSPRLFSLYHLTRASSTAIQFPPAQLLSVKTSLDAPFVGRQHHLQQLNEAYKKGGGAFLWGESGLGKTRLLKQFFAQLHPKPRLMLASCRPYETDLPFQAIIDIYRNSIQPEEWVNFPSTWINPILPLIPELADLRPDADKIVELVPGQTRSFLFESIRQITAQIASQLPLILCLDDAQWADEATLASIAYLLERPPFLKDAFLILAARTETHHPHLDRLLHILEENRKCVQITLSRFNPDEIAQLARPVLQTSPSAEFINGLARDTGGNPFFVLEALRTMAERNFNPDISSGSNFPLARSVYLLMSNRLNALSPLAHSVLEVAAVIGNEFRPELVAEAGDFSIPDIHQSLVELEQCQLVESLDTGDGNIYYHFIHDKIREALLLEINPVKIRWLHSQVAHALEVYLQQDISALAALVAHHYEAAGEWRRAFDYWVKAAKRARQLLSVEDALRSFRRAEKIMHQSSDQLTDEQIQNLYYEWNELTFDIHDSEALHNQNMLLREIGEDRRSPLLIGTALLGLGNACMSTDQFEEGVQYTTQAIHFLEKTNNLSQRVQAYIDRGVMLYMLSGWEQSMQDFQRSLELGKHLDDPRCARARANAHYNMAVIMNLRGRPLEARQHALKATGDGSSQMRTFRHVPGYSALSLAQVFLGDYSQAKHSFETGIALAEKTHNQRMLGYLLGNRALYERNTGNLGHSLENARKMIGLGEQFEHKDIIALGTRLQGDIYFYLSAPEQALILYQKGIEIGGESFLAPDILFRLGHVLCNLGQKKKGKSYLRRALKMSKENGLDLVYILAQSSLARIYADEGKWDLVYKLASKLENETRRRSLETLYLRSIHLLGEYAYANDEIDLARQRFGITLRRSCALPNPWIELKAHVMLRKCVFAQAESSDTSRERINQILDRLEASLEKAPEIEVVQDCFQNFRQKITSGIVGL
jgi:DNA-binding SARP family transcriptional activator/tetratricopeptide (TPR) repeat protein